MHVFAAAGDMRCLHKDVGDDGADDGDSWGHGDRE